MLIPIKKGKLLLSNWVQVNHTDWIRHRVKDYSEPMDVIKLQRVYNGKSAMWRLSFMGNNLKYVEETFRNTYGIHDVTDDQLDKLKAQIDKFLIKIDKLLVFA